MMDLVWIATNLLFYKSADSRNDKNSWIASAFSKPRNDKKGHKSRNDRNF